MHRRQLECACIAGSSSAHARRTCASESTGNHIVSASRRMCMSESPHVRVRARRVVMTRVAHGRSATRHPSSPNCLPCQAASAAGAPTAHARRRAAPDDGRRAGGLRSVWAAPCEGRARRAPCRQPSIACASATPPASSAATPIATKHRWKRRWRSASRAVHDPMPEAPGGTGRQRPQAS